MTDERQKAKKVKRKRDESTAKQSVFVQYHDYSLEEAFEFCGSSFADEHKILPKSTRRKVKLNKL